MINITINQEVTKKCPSCDKTISVKAKRCPYCRQDLRGFFSRHPILTFFVILITSPIWIAFLTGIFQGSINLTSPNKEDQKINSNTKMHVKQDTFVASVNFTGTEFVIANLDKNTCEAAKMEVNGDYSLNGYNLESGLESTLKSGQAQVYKVGVGQFTKRDGSRFNPFVTKPMNFNIECGGDNELSEAYWYGEFK